MILNEQLAITLISRFLNHLELLDSMNDEEHEKIISKDIEFAHADAILKNLLVVGKFLCEHPEIKWIGADKRKELLIKDNENDDSDSEKYSELVKSAPNSLPLAFVVMMDKVCKIGRKARRVLLISSCLKFFAEILISSCAEFIDMPVYESVFLSMLKFIDHVQTFTISRDQSKSQEWRSTLELSNVLFGRLKDLLGEERHSALNLKLVKTMSAARLARREEKRQMALMEPEKVAKMKAKENQKKYRARKNKTASGVLKKRK